MTDQLRALAEAAADGYAPSPNYPEYWAFIDGFIAGRTSVTRESIEEALRPVITEHHDAGANDQWWVSDHAADYADVVMELIGEVA